MKEDDDVDPDACVQTNRERKESAKFTARKVFTHTSTLTSHRHSSKVSPQVRDSLTERNVTKLQIPEKKEEKVFRGVLTVQVRARARVSPNSIQERKYELQVLKTMRGSREREEEANVVHMSAFAPRTEVGKD